jgi:hypothetical protein
MRGNIQEFVQGITVGAKPSHKNVSQYWLQAVDEAGTYHDPTWQLHMWHHRFPWLATLRLFSAGAAEKTVLDRGHSLR